MSEYQYERLITFFSRSLSDTEKNVLFEKISFSSYFGLRTNKSILESFSVERMSEIASHIYIVNKNPNRKRG